MQATVTRTQLSELTKTIEDSVIEELLVPEIPQLALVPASNAVVVTPVNTAAAPVKPRPARRRRATKAKLSVEG